MAGGRPCGACQGPGGGLASEACWGGIGRGHTALGPVLSFPISRPRQGLGPCCPRAEPGEARTQPVLQPRCRLHGRFAAQSCVIETRGARGPFCCHSKAAAPSVRKARGGPAGQGVGDIQRGEKHPHRVFNSGVLQWSSSCRFKNSWHVFCFYFRPRTS